MSDEKKPGPPPPPKSTQLGVPPPPSESARAVDPNDYPEFGTPSEPPPAAPESALVPDDLPPVPPAPAIPSVQPELPQIDMSRFEGPVSVAELEAGDRQTLHEIGQHTSKFGRYAAIVLVASAVGLGGFAYWRQTSTAAQLEEFQQLSQIEDPAQFLAEVRAWLGRTNDPDLQRRAIMNLGHHRDAQAVPLLIQALDTPGSVRRASAWALARIGLPDAEPAKAKLMEVLPDTDERDHAQVVWTLAVLREPAAADAILDAFSRGQLAHLDGFSAKIVAENLGIERLSSDALLNHPEASVRQLTANSLAEAASPQVVDPLTRLLEAELARPEDQQQEEVIRSAVAGLGRTGDPRAGAPLFGALQRRPALQGSVIDALRRSTGAPQLAALLQQAQDPALKLDLARLLAETHDDRGRDALAGLLTSDVEALKSTAALALAELRDVRALDTLLELVKSANPTVASNAADAIPKIADRNATARLLVLLRELPQFKSSFLRALGHTGDPAAAAAIRGELEGDDAPAAARALADLNDEGSYRSLVGLIVRPANREMAATNAGEREIANEELLSRRRVAIMAAGQYGRPDSLDELMRVVEDGHDDYELRELAAVSVGQVATAEQLQQVLRKIQDTSLSDVARRNYVHALWQRPHPELMGALIDLMGNTQLPLEVQEAAALAVGYAADPNADARLVALLENDATKRGAAFAIALGGGQEAVAKLVEKLGADPDLDEILRRTFTEDESDWLNLVTEDMFTGGAIWRRLRAAAQLKAGTGSTAYSYAWQKTINVLRSGWDRPGGATPYAIRNFLWANLHSNDAELRAMVAKVLLELSERGLLLRARDEGGPAGEAAREALIERPAGAEAGEQG